MKKILIIIHKLGNTLYWLVAAILFFIAGGVAVSIVNIPGNYKLYTVQSGSMFPAIHTGSVVISKPFENYSKGDVVTFKSEVDVNNISLKSAITHRIYEITTKDGKEEYVTKGDANNAPDIRPITKDLILGKIIFSIPFLGFPISFAKTREGLLILVIIPAVIIIYGELMNIKKEALILVFERRKRKLTTKEKIEVEIGEEEIIIERWYKKLLGIFFIKGRLENNER